MIKIFYLLTLANQFIQERNWWQFHNPKNDSINILVEATELAEHFIQKNDEVKKEIAEEISDVLLGSLYFALLTKIDISNVISLKTGNQILKDDDSSFEQLQNIVLNNLDKFNLKDLKIPYQVVLSLTRQAGKLADIFIWNTTEQSKLRELEKHELSSKCIASIVAHIIYLSYLMDIDLPSEFINKMKRNNLKYPVNKSSGEDYIKIKDKFRQ